MKAIKTIVLSVSLMLISSVCGLAQTVNWSGGAGNWSQTVPPDAAGWDTAVPTTEQRAQINGTDDITVPNAASEVANDVRISTGGSLTIAAGGTLTTYGGDPARSVWIGQNGTGNSLTVDGYLNAASERLDVGGFGNNERSGTLTINSGGIVASDGLQIRNNSTVTINGGTLNARAGVGVDSLVIDTRQQNGGYGAANRGHLQLNSGFVTTRNLLVNEDSTATVVDGVLTVGNELRIGRVGAAQRAVFTQTGGRVDVLNNMVLSEGNNSAEGQYDLSGGNLYVENTLNLNQGTGGVGEFNLSGGGRLQLRILNADNAVGAENVFNWSEGVLTKSQYFNTLMQFTGAAGQNTALTIGDGVGSGDAILDLGISYLNGGVRQTFLDGQNQPSLVLNSDSYLSAVGSAHLHRVLGVGNTSSGFVNLLQQFDGGITGQFGGWSGAGIPEYTGSTVGITDPSDLPLESILLVYVDSDGDASFEPGFSGTATGVRLWYNLQGAAPEPTTVAFVVMGSLLLRLSRSRHFQRSDSRGKAT